MDKKLTNEVCIKLWNKLDKPSLRAVREESGRLGYLNPDTGRPYSRQWIRVLLSETPEGRIRLGRPANSSALKKVRRQPLIVEDRKQYLNWYIQHGFVGYTIVPPNKVDADIVRDRYVYGDIPLSLAVFAQSVFLPELREDGSCVLTEYKLKKIR